MQKRVALFVLILVALMATMAIAEVKGPFVDNVYFNVRMKTDVGIMDVAEGKSDIFWESVDGAVFLGLAPEVIDKLEVYAVPSGSWSLLINPAPNAAPYTTEVDGVDRFNPFAIREVRFALNFLINRKYVVDEILNGAGFPAYTMATAGQPGTYKYNLLATEFGFSAEGNEKKAIQMITDALTAASKVPENAGRLVKGTPFWTFDGEPVSINFLIRVDDPTGRLVAGNYYSDLIEKAGIKVERLLWDRSKCGSTVYGAVNPADQVWHMYTEGWGAGATRRYWEHIVAQMYAPWYGYMPGGQNDGIWNYENAEIDKYTQNAYYGKYLTVDEYWEYALEGLKLGLSEAVRFYVCNQESFFVANKARFENRFAYGLGDGLNRWTLVTADTADKKLNVTQYSARGSLFMDAWDPIGPDGFASVYSTAIARPLTDASTFESPVSAINTQCRVTWNDADVVTQVEKNADGDVVGTVEVPANAIRYNTTTKSWETVGEGVFAQTVATYSFRLGNFHDGTPESLVQYLHAIAFTAEWATEDGADDKYYDPQYSSSNYEGTLLNKGIVLNADGTWTQYYDYNFPGDVARVASRCAPTGNAGSTAGISVAWYVAEALSRLVAGGAEGNPSGTPYNFEGNSDNEVDIIVAEDVADIRAEFEEMIAEQYVPECIKDYVTVEEALASYANAIAFIDAHGHAYISNGPFYINTLDRANNYIELAANRDEAYPFTSQEWVDLFAVPMISIDKVSMPSLVPAGKDLEVKVKLSKTIYPSNTPERADEGTVEVRILADEEIVTSAQVTNTGDFKVVVPGSLTQDLTAGTYDVMIQAELEGAVPVSIMKTIVVW